MPPTLEMAPREGKYASANGYYNLVVRASNSIVNKGENLIIEIYITGYGQIKNAKFVFYPSIGVIDERESTMIWDLNSDGRIFFWGREKKKIGNTTGVFIDLGRGIHRQNWKEDDRTIFIDNPRDDISAPQIITEVNSRGFAPIVLDLHIHKKASSGNHFLHFGFTYFNGEEWAGSNHLIPFTIKNVFQKHEVLIQGIGILVAILTILVTVLTVFDLVMKYFLKTN